MSLGYLGYSPKLKHRGFSRNFLVFHCVSKRQSSVTSQIISLISQVVFFTQVLKVVKARYQCFSALLVFFFNFRQKCNTCKNLTSLNALLARFLQESCRDCIALQESCKECIVLKDSCTRYMFCKNLARISRAGATVQSIVCIS